ncbi:NRDE family protein [Luteimonas sp. R10]|uniref:NRDE family protein n=1 Tax=Luteimonas sp. R10 TaxID=3108176 RepID=UPI0030915B36|nr:NRDE family protein [Luteimonas sp. R10]
MCLIAIAWNIHPRFPLALIANRDESHARPAAAAEADPEAPDVYGGRDLVGGGSWLQVSTRGRLAAVTNVREGLAAEAAPRSRGWLVRDFTRGDTPAGQYVEALQPLAHEYGRFNLLVWDGDALAFASNHPAMHAPVAPGVHAMSNGAFDAAWPKSGHATRALTAWLESLPNSADPANDPDLIEPLFAALADTATAPDTSLPDTGIGLELERALSPPFVLGETYGTRSSSVVLVERGRIVFAERRFGPNARALGGSVAALTRTT